jgi:uncharacterized protein (DUF1501 family)
MWTRRAFLKSGGLAVFSAGLGGCPPFLGGAAPASALPATGQGRKVLVVLFQRGAMDGLMAAQPLHDAHLARARPSLVLPATGDGALLDLDGAYGLHPALAPLKYLFDDGHLAVVHGVGSPVATRSHFDAQGDLESGTPGVKSTGSGWLNRAATLLGHEVTPFRAVAPGPALPRALHGEAPALALGAPDNAGPEKNSPEALDMLGSLHRSAYRPAHGVLYPETLLGDSLRQIAHLIKAGVGLEIAFAESTGWDTHFLQGTPGGSFARLSRDLARSIAAFWTDLEAHRDDVVLMTMTEFGRTVAENAAGGTNHGRASCLFVLGNAVRGGRVYGMVPALAPEALEDGRDLPVTTDFRAVAAEVAGTHLGLAGDDALFPGWDGARLPLMQVPA